MPPLTPAIYLRAQGSFVPSCPLIAHFYVPPTMACATAITMFAVASTNCLMRSWWISWVCNHDRDDAVCSLEQTRRTSHELRKRLQWFRELAKATAITLAKHRHVSQVRSRCKSQTCSTASAIQLTISQERERWSSQTCESEQDKLAGLQKRARQTCRLAKETVMPLLQIADILMQQSTKTSN